MIPYGRHHITQHDIDAVIEVLNSDFLTQGPRVPAFEKAVSTKVGAEYALAVNSATSALHIACLALGLGRADLIWTSPITFVASANCGIYCGASIDFVDIDPQSYNICVKGLESKLVRAKQDGKLPKILVVVHFAGQSCDMEAIHTLSIRFGFKVIEDASHAVGGHYQNEYIGNCRFSDITIFSFHPVKIITTAEGGMALTNDHLLAQRMNLFRSHGITRDQDLMTHNADGPWYYQQIELGYNYRMTELQAALGISQIKRLDEYVNRRRELAKRYDHLLASLPLVTPFQNSFGCSSFHLYVVRLKLNKIRLTREDVFRRLLGLGVGVNVHYIPVHTQPYFLNMGFKIGDFPESEAYYSEAISLPIYQDLTDDQQNKIVQALNVVLDD